MDARRGGMGLHTILLDPTNPKRIYIAISAAGAFRTDDGGKTWRRQADGMPTSQAWWTVKRQAMTADRFTIAGVYFGTTSGEVWGSRDEGRKWKRLAEHLPEIYAIEAA